MKALPSVSYTLFSPTNKSPRLAPSLGHISGEKKPPGRFPIPKLKPRQPGRTRTWALQGSEGFVPSQYLTSLPAAQRPLAEG